MVAMSGGGGGGGSVSYTWVVTMVAMVTVTMTMYFPSDQAQPHSSDCRCLDSGLQ